MQKKGLFFQIFLYCLCGLLVVLFVNLYSFWVVVDQLLPAHMMKALPVAAVIIFVFAALFYLSRIKTDKSEVNWFIFGAGVAVSVLALLVPDRQFPVKRIHVFEYMVLACLVRYVMSWRIQGRSLLFFSVLGTILFGIHDELLQGVHPLRTYGLRDMVANGVAAVGGGLIWHGGGLFIRPGIISHKRGERKEYVFVTAYLVWLCLCILAFIVPLTAYRQEIIPYWPLIPLSGVIVLWSLYYQKVEGQLQYGCLVVNCLISLYLAYPVVINASSCIFH